MACPACQRLHDVKLVQSINARSDRAAHQQLLAGELNVLDCDCGTRTQLVAKLVFHDPDRDYFAQVAPDEAALAEARIAFQASGATGTLRVVPSQNALVEKLKLLEAGLEDWAIEMTKVLLLASAISSGTIMPDALDTVLLFDSLDHPPPSTPHRLAPLLDQAGGVIHWVRFDGAKPERVASALAAYEKLAARDASRPRPDEIQIDRAWAMHAVQSMIANAN